jgi:hypothetical protein
VLLLGVIGGVVLAAAGRESVALTIGNPVVNN